MRKLRWLGAALCVVGLGVVPDITSAAAAETPVDWVVMPSPNVAGSSGNGLSDVSCTSASFCMAVGFSPDGPLAQMWDGTAWTVVSMATVPGSDGTLVVSVSCASPSFCMAVGGYTPSGASVGSTFAEDWDGSAWAVVDSPNGSPAGPGDYLTGVSCTSAVSCHATGTHDNNQTTDALALTWNGTSWSSDSAVNVTDYGNYLGRVSCVPGFCLAAGYDRVSPSTPADQLMAEKFNGSSWSNAAPATRGTGGELAGLSCSSKHNCMATGETHPPNSGDPLVEHYDGSSWSIQTLPTIGSVLSDASCASDTACTVVGNGGLIEAWNGSTWAVNHTPQSVERTNRTLNGVSCVTAKVCTAVGSYTLSGVPQTFIEQRFTVTKVSPAAGSLTGGNTVTVHGVGIDRVTGVQFVPQGGEDPLDGTDVTIVSPTTLTVVSPDASAALADGATSVPTDVVLLDGAGESEVVRPADVYTFGCKPESSVADGAWDAAGCFTEPDTTDYQADASSNLDGLVVKPAKQTTVDYATKAQDVTSTGSASVSLNLTRLSKKTTQVPILSGGDLDVDLSGAPVSVTLPANFTLAGIGLTSGLKLTPKNGGTFTGTALANLPPVLGGGTAKATLESVLHKGVTSFEVTAKSGTLANLFHLDAITLSYSKGTWQVSASATTPGGAAEALTGSLTYGADGSLTGGALTVHDIAIGGLVTLKSFTVSFSKSSGWTGSASLEQGSQKATVALSFDKNGTLTAGSLHASGVTLFGVFELKKFDLDYNRASSAWTLSIEVAHESSGASASARFSEVDGAVQGVDLDIKHIEFLKKITLNELQLNYSRHDGHVTYHAKANVELPGTIVTGVEGELTFTDGLFEQGKLVLHGNVPLFEVVFLHTLGAELRVSPHEEVTGTVGLSAGPKIDGKTLLDLDGSLKYRFGSGTYTLDGSLSALNKTLGEGTITLDGDKASVDLSLGEKGAGFELASFATLHGSVSGHLVRRSFTLRGKIELTVKSGGHTYTAKAEVTANNRGIVACGHFPALGDGSSGVAEEWGGKPALKKDDCAPANF